MSDRCPSHSVINRLHCCFFDHFYVVPVPTRGAAAADAVDRSRPHIRRIAGGDAPAVDGCDGNPCCRLQGARRPAARHDRRGRHSSTRMPARILHRGLNSHTRLVTNGAGRCSRSRWPRSTEGTHALIWTVRASPVVLGRWCALEGCAKRVERPPVQFGHRAGCPRSAPQGMSPSRYSRVPRRIA